MFDDMDFFSDDKPSVEKDIDIEPKSGGVFSDFNFFENTAPDLENISYADKFAYGTAQETTIGRNIFSAIKAGVESGVSDKTFQQALKDMEDERQRDIDRRFPRFRGLQESEEDLSILSGRIGVAVADPVTFMIPWLKLAKAGTLGQKMTKLGAAGAGLGATDTFTRDLALYGEVSPARTALGATIGAGSTLAGFGVERFISNRLLKKSLEDAEPSPATVNAPDLSVDEAGAVDSAVKSAASKIELDTPKITTRLSILQEYQKGVESVQSQIQKINERLGKLREEPDFDEALEKTLESNRRKLRDQQKKLLDTFALKSMELADEKARLSAEAIENLAKGEGFTQKAARAIMTELTKPLYGAGSGAIYGFSTREDSEDMESVYVSAALGAGLGAAWKRIDSSEAITSMVKDQTKMVINEAGFNYARVNLKHLFGGTTATKMDAMGGWNKVIGNILFSRYGVAGDSVESRSLKAQSEWIGRLTNNLGDSGADDDVLEAVGEALFDFVPDDKLVGWKGLSGTRNALTEEQASEVRRIVPLLRESQDFIKNRVSETGIPFEELEFYGMALRFDFTKDPDKLRGHLEEAARIHNKEVKASGKGKKLNPKSYAAKILGDNNAPNIKYGKGGSSPFKYDTETKQYTFRPLAEFFETSRSLTSPEAIKYLAQNDALVLNARDVLADYGSSSLKVAEFAEAVGPNGELVNLALKRTKEAFKGKPRSIGERFPITTMMAQMDSAIESSGGQLPAGSRYVDQLVGGVEAFWGKRGEYSKASDGLRIGTTFANLSYLTFVSFANLVDLTQPFVKSGVKASLQALKQKNISRIAPTKSMELGGKSFAEMSHFQYDPSFERELETLLKSKSINDNNNVSKATDWINSKFFEYVQLKNVTAVARKFAYDAGVNRAFNLAEKFASTGKMTRTLQKELDSLNLTVEDIKNIGKYSDVREAFDENNARAFLDKAGRAAAERDSIIANVGNRMLFSQTNSPLIRSIGQFLSWSQAKSSELNAMVRQIENGDVKLLHRMALAAPVMIAFEELRRAAQGLSGIYEKEETPEQVDEMQRLAKGLERTGMFNNFQLSFIMDQARYTYNSEEFSAADSLSPALSFISDFIGAGLSATEDVLAGDKEGAAKEFVDVLPPFKQIQSATKFVTGEDLLVDEPNTEREEQPVNFEKGGEVDVPRAPSEPDERIDKMTGRPYDQQAGTAFVDEEDPLRRLGFTGGGEIDPLKRLGFGA